MSETPTKDGIASTPNSDSQHYPSFLAAPDAGNASSCTRPSLIDDTVYDMAWKAYTSIMLKNRLHPS